MNFLNLKKKKKRTEQCERKRGSCETKPKRNSIHRIPCSNENELTTAKLNVDKSHKQLNESKQRVQTV